MNVLPGNGLVRAAFLGNAACGPAPKGKFR